MHNHAHAIIIIKNKNNEYLQYYDKRWGSNLFDEYTKQDIINVVVDKLNIPSGNLVCSYPGNKVHRKFSESAKIEKKYHHYFYHIDIKNMPDVMKDKKFIICSLTYC